MARSFGGEVRVDGPVLGMSMLGGAKSSAVCGCAVERATGTTSVRIFGCIQHKSVQARGGAVSEATATTESVVVEALRMSNSLCEAMGEPSRRTGSKEK